MDFFSRMQVLAFHVVKFSWMSKFDQFYVDFMLVAAKFVFLTCTVAVVEIEGYAAMLLKLKLISQYDQYDSVLTLS